MSKKKIAIITHNYPDTVRDRKNAGVFVYDFAEELGKRSKVSVLHLSRRDSPFRVGQTKVFPLKWHVRKKLGHFNALNPLDYLTYTLSFLLAARSLLGFHIKNREIDFYLAMWALPSGLFGLILKTLFGKKYAVWVLGSDVYKYSKFPIVGYFIGQVIKRSDYVFADGIDLKNKAEELSGREVLFLPSASKFNNKPLSKMRLARKKSKIRITFLGRMEPVKGPDIFLSALGRLGSKISLLDVHMIGDGSLTKALIKEARLGKIGKHITFHGNISNPVRIKSILSTSDWLVIPSRSDSIPLVFSEAMKARTPIIASDLPDLQYLVKKYMVGLNFKKEDPKHLALILSKAMKDEKKRESYKQNTVKAARDFDVRQSVRKFIKVVDGGD